MEMCLNLPSDCYHTVLTTKNTDRVQQVQANLRGMRLDLLKQSPVYTVQSESSHPGPSSSKTQAWNLKFFI
jgi:hypothetical protein